MNETEEQKPPNIVEIGIGRAWRFAGEHPRVTQALIILGNALLNTDHSPQTQIMVATMAITLGEAASISRLAEDTASLPEAQEDRREYARIMREEYSRDIKKRLAVTIGQALVTTWAAHHAADIISTATPIVEQGVQTIGNAASAFGRWAEPGVKQIGENVVIPAAKFVAEAAVAGGVLYKTAKEWKKHEPRKALQRYAVQKWEGSADTRKLMAIDASILFFRALRQPAKLLDMMGGVLKWPKNAIDRRILNKSAARGTPQGSS